MTCLPCSENCKLCQGSEDCEECLSDDYHLLDKKCVDCRDPQNSRSCFSVLQVSSAMDASFNLEVSLLFNREFSPVENLDDRDIYLETSLPGDSYLQVGKRIAGSQGKINLLLVQIQLLKSFARPQELNFMVPPESRLMSQEGIRVNEISNQTIRIANLAL